MRSLLYDIYPQGIDTTFQRQLNRLPQVMYPLLTAVAVAGAEIDPDLLTQLVDDLGYPFTSKQWLIASVSAALVEMEDDQPRFADEALRLFLLAALSENEKKHWHLKIITALQAIYPDDLGQAAALAFHWQQVGNEAQEQKYARLAGAYAQQQHDLDTAVQYLNRALHLTPEENLPEQYDLLLMREQVYHLQGIRDAQKEDLTRLAEIADQLSAVSGQARRTEVALRLGAFAEVTGEYTIAIVAASEALRLADGTQAKAHQAGSHLLWGQALLRQGKYEEALEKLQLSRSQAQSLQLSQIEADSFRAMGVCATDLGQFDLAKQYFDSALSLYRQLNDLRGESTVLNNLSVVAYAKNQLVAAVEHWEKSRSIHQTIGDKEGTARVLSNLGSVCLDLGAYEKGQAYCLEALSICREADLRFGQGLNLINLALSNYYLNSDRQAEIFSQAALQLAQEMKSVPLEGLALKDRAYLLLQWQRFDEAAQTYQQALAIWQQLAQPLQLLEVQAGLAQASLGQGWFEQARDSIVPVVAHLLAGNTAKGCSRPFFIYLACYKVLAASQDRNARTILQQAHDQLLVYASNFANETERQTFFENVPEIVHIRNLLVEPGQDDTPTE